MSDSKLIVSKKPPKGEDGYKTFSIRIKDELVEKLDNAAKESGRSRNELIGMFLEYALEHVSIEGK